MQSAILLGIGLQHKTVDVLVTELDLPANQLLALFNKAIRKLSEYLDQLCINSVREEIDGQGTNEHSVDVASMQPVPISLDVSFHPIQHLMQSPVKIENCILYSKVYFLYL